MGIPMDLNNAVMRSRSGARAVRRAADNLLLPPGALPPAVLSKFLMAPHHATGFDSDEPYTDLQSANSEDAMTISYFSSLEFSFIEQERVEWVRWLVRKLKLPIDPAKITLARLNLFRKVAQAETGRRGGRELDILITTNVAIFLIEAKWTGDVTCGQGTNRDLNQIELDRLYAQWLLRHLPALVDNAADFYVVLVGIHLQKKDAFTKNQDAPPFFERSITLEDLCADECPHPNIEDVHEYFDWRIDLMKRD